ncbi:MAG: oligosaccharide flippase family protein [Ruminococcus sp.]|nr:oligosaccharide flippase family protein [Ruminococcus sp.]
MKNQLKIGSLLSYVQMAINIIIHLIYTPIMIRLLGQSEYGLYNTVASAMSMLSLLSLGFNSGYIRYYAIYKRNDDKGSISKLNGLFLIIFLIIGVVGLLCGSFLSFHLNIIFDNGLTENEYGIARILSLLLTINLSVSFPMSVFTTIINAHEKFIFMKIVGMIKTVFSPLITLPLLLLGFRSIAMVSVTVGMSLFCDILYLWFVFFKMKEKFVFRNFEKGIFKSLFAYTFFIALNMLIEQVNWNIDKLLLGRFKGTSEVAIYSVGYTLYSLYMMFSTSVSSVFTPRIHKLVNDNKNDLEKQKSVLTDIFVRVGRIQFLILGLVLTGVIFFGHYFIVNIWAGEGYEKSYWVAVIAMTPTIVPLMQNMGIEIQRAQNRHQFRSIIYSVMAVVNLLLSIYLCQIYGAIGSIIGTAVAAVIAYGIIMNIYYNTKCNIDIPNFWKNILRMSLGLIIPCFLGAIILKTGLVTSLTRFCFFVIAYTLVYCGSMWFISMNDYEKDLIRSPIKRILHL